MIRLVNIVKLDNGDTAKEYLVLNTYNGEIEHCLDINLSEFKLPFEFNTIDNAIDFLNRENTDGKHFYFDGRILVKFRHDNFLYPKFKIELNILKGK